MRDEYKVIRGGKKGTGLLIEGDAGFIEPNDIRNKPFIGEVSKVGNGNQIMIEPLILFVVLQKYGVKNKNGRIYPEHILKREARNYEQLIRSRSAIGECVPRGTEIYTKQGWREIQDMNVGDEIFTLNTKTNKLEINSVKRTTEKKYNDDMVRIYNKQSLDMMVTKKHKIVLWDRNDKPYILTAEELYDKIINKDSKVSHSTIKHSGEWVGENVSTIKIPNSDYEIDSKLWAAFLGIFLADGHCSGTKGGNNKNMVCITQVKSDTKKEIKKLLDLLPFKYSISDDRQFLIYDKPLFDFLFELGNSYEKFIPQYAKDWSVELLEELLSWMLMGDGRNRKNKDGKLMREYYTTSSKLSDDVFEVFLKVSNGSTYNKRIPKDRYITDTKFITEEIDVDGELQLIKKLVKSKHLIKAENSKELNIISERTSKGISLDHRFTKAEKIPFNDDVHCVTVDNGTWLMRYNGKVSWTHNSDHPESSVISNSRVSHEIKKIWWEGVTLVGELEIIMSPGFINQGIISCEGDNIANMLRKGIRVGVSSRGVGSLEDEGGKLMVQEDFELICWDIVTSPSTPGSYMFNSKSEAQPFMESETKNKNLLLDDLDKFLL